MVCAGLLLGPLAACGSWTRAGSPEPTNVPPERLPQLFDPIAAFGEMGLIAQGGSLPVIGMVRVLAGPSPDTLLAMIALSLRNRGFTFRREGDRFEAEYRVEVTLRQGGQAVKQLSRDERVRVATFRETQRSDESVIFQQFLPVTPGPYVLSLSVRDRNSSNATHVEFPVTVPPLGASTVALPIPVYEWRPRATLTETPGIVVNPRASVEYGADSARFYLETYRLPAGRRLVASATDPGGRITWVDTIEVDSTAPVRTFGLSIPPQRLAIGRHELRVRLDDAVAAETPFLVTFSDQYAVANLEEIVSLLRYFPGVDSLRAILNAPLEQRGAAWQAFWRRSDPNPTTPENEALDSYLARLRVANQRFPEEGVPGWLTDRGEVFVTMGEPDDFIDRRPDIQGRGRYIIWNYYQQRLSLTFVDESGFGRFRLDPRSRSEYLRVLSRIRRQ